MTTTSDKERLELAAKAAEIENIKQNKIKEFQDKGYSPGSIAMYVGGPVGTIEYYDVLKQVDPEWGQIGCSRCGGILLGIGNCNCGEE